MTVVNPKSISGINSITTGSGSDNLLTIHTSDAANTERLRIDSTGATKIVTGIVTTLTATTGIVTTLTTNTLTANSTAKVGSGVTLSPDGDVFATGVTTCLGTAVLGNTIVGAAVTITSSGIEASGIGITCANINGTQIGGRRNLVINGAMNVAQRGTSSTSDGYHTVDRFEIKYGGEDEAPTAEQATLTSAPGPYREGHRKAFKFTNGNNTGGAGASDYIFARQKIEAQDIASSGWDYIKPESFITLSFWVKSSVAQNFHGYLRSHDGTEQQYPFSTGSLTADTWTKVIKTIPGNSNLQFDNNAEQGLALYLVTFLGTSYTDNSVTEDAWGAYDAAARVKDNTSTWWTTNDATFELTGVQLEVGSQATPFEHRSFAEEERLCMRYFEKLRVDSFPMQPAGNNGVNSETRIPYQVKKRSAPTVIKDGNLSLTLNGTNSNNTDHSLGGGNTTAATYGIHVFAVISGSSYSHATMVNSATFLCDCEL